MCVCGGKMMSTVIMIIDFMCDITPTSNSLIYYNFGIQFTVVLFFIYSLHFCSLYAIHTYPYEAHKNVKSQQKRLATMQAKKNCVRFHGCCAHFCHFAMIFILSKVCNYFGAKHKQHWIYCS